MKEFCELICQWNISKKYKKYKKTEKDLSFRNSQDFVDDILDFMEIQVKSECLKTFLSRIKEKGSTDLKINFKLDFQKKFKLKSHEYTFNTHQTIDQFVDSLLIIDPCLEQNHPDEYTLLKAFDRLFWSKYHYITSNFTKVEKEYEKVIQDRMNLLFEHHEGDDESEIISLNQKYIKLKQDYEYFKKEKSNNTPLEKDGWNCCPFNDPKSKNI